MLHSLPILFYSFISIFATQVDIKVNGKKPASFSDCPILVVAGDQKHKLVDNDLADLLSPRDTFYLEGTESLAGFKSRKMVGLGAVDFYFNVLILVDVPLDSIGTKCSHCPKNGYTKIKIATPESTWNYILHSGKQDLTFNSPRKIVTDIESSKKKRKN